jgi:hypothetical protein
VEEEADDDVNEEGEGDDEQIFSLLSATIMDGIDGHHYWLTMTMKYVDDEWELVEAKN